MKLKSIIDKLLPYNKIFIFLLCLIIILLSLWTYVRRNVIYSGSQENKIIFGQTCSLSKKNANLGKEYSLGYILAFDYLNRNGGVNGKFLELIVYDDHYDGTIALDNVKTLIGYFNVFAILGSVGTPTSVAIEDYLQNKNVPLIQPLTGTNILRDTFKENIIHTRPSYYDELKLILNNLLKNNKTNISVIYQNDNFGISGLNDIQFIVSLNDYQNKFNILSYGGYEPSNILLDDALKSAFKMQDIYNDNEIKENKIFKNLDAVIIIGTDTKVIQAIRYLKPIKSDIAIYTISFAEINNVDNKISSLSDDLLNDIYITQIFPDIESMNPNLIKLVKSELELYKKKDKVNTYYLSILRSKKLSNILIEGFLNGLLVGDVLKDLKEITRESFIKEFYKKKNFDIFNFKYGPYLNYEDCKDNIDPKLCPCNTGLRYVYLYKYNVKKRDFDEIEQNEDELYCRRV